MGLLQPTPPEYRTPILRWKVLCSYPHRARTLSCNRLNGRQRVTSRLFNNNRPKPLSLELRQSSYWMSTFTGGKTLLRYTCYNRASVLFIDKKAGFYPRTIPAWMLLVHEVSGIPTRLQWIASL